MDQTDEIIAAVNDTYEDDLHPISGFELVFWYLMYTIVAVFAVVGNCMVILIILTRKHMRSITNLFIFNLALTDAISGFLIIPLKFQAALLQKWILPHFMCQLIPFLETCLMSADVFILMMSTFEKWKSLFGKNPRQFSKNTIIGAIVVVWVFSIAISIPYGVFHECVHPPWDPSATHFICNAKFAEDVWWKVYNIYLTIVQYFVPVIFVNFVEGLTIYTLVSDKPLPSSQSLLEKQFENAKKKVLTLLIIVVLCFTLCWLPFEMYLLLSEVSDVNSYSHINIIFFSFHWLAMTNSALNPILYYNFNAKWKKEIRNMLRFKCKDRSEPNNRRNESDEDNDRAISIECTDLLKCPLSEKQKKDEAMRQYILNEVGLD